MADDAHLSRVRRGGRSDVLWSKSLRPIPACRRSCRQDSARGEAGRHPGRTADEVRFRHQSDDRQGARLDDPGVVPPARRRGDRVIEGRGKFKMKLPHRRQFLHLAAGAAALSTVSRFAWAQTYPTRPVRVIVPVAPGGGSDITARLMGQWLSERLGQPFIIENRPGGALNIATEAVVRAPADGYTLLLATTTNTINATLYDKLNF